MEELTLFLYGGEREKKKKRESKSSIEDSLVKCIFLVGGFKCGILGDSIILVQISYLY